ncbi:sodium-independent sulfate anion transporter-like [Lycorma delicatula]|uniref:sodium-independent sulfate anion transporter-like n=1 Tax=Lycorma delicatula TaxID=130591 RepID=UPI003F518DA9
MSSRKGTIFLSKHLPVIRWLQSYTKMKFVSDIIAGVTVGVTMIPQSIAYAALAGLTPQYGLNSAFIGCFVYAIFGTIKEVSIGPTSLMAILATTYTNNLSPDFIIFFTFLSGCVELLMGLLKLGFLVDFVPVPVIGGFVSAVAIIVFVSQLKDMMGIKFKSSGVIHNIVSLMKNYDKIRFYDLALGIFCVVILLFLRVREKNKKSFLKSTVWFISISRNAIVVLFCMSLTALLQYHFNSIPFTLTDSVVSGLPVFKMPPVYSQVGNVTYTFTDMIKTIGPGMFILPLIAVLENIAMAKVFSKGKTIEVTQEMFALSFCNILGSCFGGMPACGALSRSAVSNASGVQSPIASLYSGTIVLLAVSFLSPYFCLIPRATLAAVLICAIIFLIEWEILIPLWKTSKKDFIIMLVTYFLCIILGVEIGLLSGIMLSLLHLIYLWAYPKITSEVCVVCNGQKYVLLHLDKGLYFPSLGRLRNTILELRLKEQVNIVVIDCTYFSGMDFTATKELCLLIAEVNEDGGRLLLLNANPQFIKLFNTAEHCKMPLDYSFSSKDEIEVSICKEEVRETAQLVVEILKSDDCKVHSSDVKTINREVFPLLENDSVKLK